MKPLAQVQAACSVMRRVVVCELQTRFIRTTAFLAAAAQEVAPIPLWQAYPLLASSASGA